jgi:Family of unknown function (DUF5309)
MLLEKNVVGKKTDWANYITLADEHETPMLRVLPKGPKPVNVIKNYQADTYNAPQQNAWPDGKDWDAFKSAGQNRVALSARVQWFVQTAAVSKLAEDVTDTAGIEDELAHEIPKKMTEMAREMECAAGSDNASFADDGNTGHKFRAAGAWIANPIAADADVAPGASIVPPAANISTATKANTTEDAIKVILQSMWQNTGSKSLKVGFVGSSLKKRFGEFQFYIPTSTSTQSTWRVTKRDEDDSSLGNVVDRYDSDWGPLELHLSRWLAHENFGGSVTKAQWRGYFLNASRWSWLWNQKPTVYKPEFKGGSYKAAIDAILMFLCWNPIGEGKVAPSDA